MLSDLAGKWINWWQPLLGGLTRWGLASGLPLTCGWFWARVRGGCLLYRGLSTRAAINYDHPVGAAGHDATEMLQYDWIASPAGPCWYAARIIGPGGLEARTSPPPIGLVIGETGQVLGGLPGDIERAWAQPAGAGRIQVCWRYSPTYETDPPVEFRIYHDAGSGSIDYEHPIAVPAWDLRRNTYRWLSEPYADGTRVRFAVRAASAAGEGSGAEAAAVADATVRIAQATMTIEKITGEVTDAG
jgi:hypothetical protein